ncbi:MAG: hypothetical protein ACLR6J_15315 [Parabacteroides merdae]
MPPPSEARLRADRIYNLLALTGVKTIAKLRRLLGADALLVSVS